MNQCSPERARGTGCTHGNGFPGFQDRLVPGNVLRNSVLKQPGHLLVSRKVKTTAFRRLDLSAKLTLESLEVVINGIVSR